MATIEKNTESMTTKVGGYVTKMGDQIGGEVGELVSKVGEGFEKIGSSSSAGWAKVAAGGAVVAGVGIALQSFASKGQQAEAQLKVAVDNTGDSFDDYEGKISKAEASGAKFGDTNTQVANALQVLVQATGSTDTALSDLNVTYDLAAAKHISLADAASLVAKVYTGSSKTLKQFGVDMTVTAGNTDQATAALAALDTKISGQANASVDNFGGKVNQAKATVTDWADKMAAFAGGPLTYVGTAVGVVSGVIDIWSARSTRAAVAVAELGAANAEEATTAEASAVANTEAATSANALGAASERAAVAQGSSRLAAGGAMLGVVALGVGAYYAGNAISNYTEKNNSFVKALNSGTTNMQAFTDAITQDGDAVGAQSQKAAIAALQTSGLADKAAKAHISLAQLTTGVTGGADAFDKLVASWRAGGQPSDDTLAALTAIAQQFAQGKTTADDDTEAQKKLAASTTYATSTTLDLGAALDQTNKDFTDGADKMGHYSAAEKELTGNTLDAAQSQNQFLDSIDSITTAQQNANDVLKKSGKSSADYATATRQVNEAVLSSISNINQMIDSSIQAGDTTDQTNAKIKDWNTTLDTNAAKFGLSKGALDSMITSYETSPKNLAYQVIIDNSQALYALGSVASQLNYLAGLEHTDLATYNSLIGGFNQFVVAPNKEKQSGGVVGAASGRIVNGMTLVGEHGPELADLAPGTQVHSNPDSMRMASQSGGSGWNGVVTLVVEGSGDFVDLIRKNVRIKGGGNVQKAFGYGSP